MWSEVFGADAPGGEAPGEGPQKIVLSYKGSDARKVLKSVTHAAVCEDDTPAELLRQVRPDVLVKGGNYCLDEVVGKEIVEEYVVQVPIARLTEDVSTTSVICRLRATTSSP